MYTQLVTQLANEHSWLTTLAMNFDSRSEAADCSRVFGVKSSNAAEMSELFYFVVSETRRTWAASPKRRSATEQFYSQHSMASIDGLCAAKLRDFCVHQVQRGMRR